MGYYEVISPGYASLRKQNRILTILSIFIFSSIPIAYYFFTKKSIDPGLIISVIGISAAMLLQGYLYPKAYLWRYTLIVDENYIKYP